MHVTPLQTSKHVFFKPLKILTLRNKRLLRTKGTNIIRSWIWSKIAEVIWHKLHTTHKIMKKKKRKTSLVMQLSFEILHLKSWDTNKLLQQSTTTAITYNLLPENYETPSTQKRKLKYYVRVNRQSRNQVHEALHRDVPNYNDCSFKPDMKSAYACTTLRFRTIHKHSYGTILFRQRQQFVRMLFSCTQDTMKWHCLWTTIKIGLREITYMFVIKGNHLQCTETCQDVQKVQ